MSLLGFEGFDASPTSVSDHLSLLGWTINNGGSVTATGRKGTGKAATRDSSGIAGQGQIVFKWPVPTGDVFVVGMAFKIPSVPSVTNAVLFTFENAAGVQCSVYANCSTKALRVTRGADSATIATSANDVYTPDVWFYLEFKATIHDSTGTYEVRVDGVNILSGTGVDTKQQATSDATFIGIQGGMSVTYDDFYCVDDAGSAPWNDFLGDVESLARAANGDGTVTDWTPSTGTDNSAMVDETSTDGDSTYNSASTSGLVDRYSHADVPSGSTIYGVSHRMLVRKTDAGVTQVRSNALINGSVYTGSDVPVSDSYNFAVRDMQTNPDTSAQWSLSDVNAMEIGPESR